MAIFKLPDGTHVDGVTLVRLLCRLIKDRRWIDFDANDIPILRTWNLQGEENPSEFISPYKFDHVRRIAFALGVNSILLEASDTTGNYSQVTVSGEGFPPIKCDSQINEAHSLLSALINVASIQQRSKPTT